MVFRNKIKNSEVDISIGTTKIERVGRSYKTKAVKFLGILVEDGAKWTEQAKKTIEKTAKGLFMLQQSRHVLNLKNKLLLYQGLIESKLSYGALAWVPLTPKKYIEKMQKSNF